MNNLMRDESHWTHCHATSDERARVSFCPTRVRPTRAREYPPPVSSLTRRIDVISRYSLSLGAALTSPRRTLFCASMCHRARNHIVIMRWLVRVRGRRLGAGLLLAGVRWVRRRSSRVRASPGRRLRTRRRASANRLARRTATTRNSLTKSRSALATGRETARSSAPRAWQVLTRNLPSDEIRRP